MTDTASLDNRRTLWKPPARPEWVRTLNEIGHKLDARAVAPLDEQSLIEAAMRNTGLSDFDEDGWRDHFRVLLKAIEDEAKITFYGRILTRSDLIQFLQARLQITEAFKRNPEIADEKIVEPVFILGFGRSGTTILHETLSQDPQFRTVRRWEALYPTPSPEEATYESDSRIAKAQDYIDLIHWMCPEIARVHAMGAEIPVEDLEFTWLAFFSEVWMHAFQVPSYARYYYSQDPSYQFRWHKKMLQVLQWKFKKPHWLLKSPMYMSVVPQLLDAYPDAKIILPHRDPIVSADSIVNMSGTVFHWRTDDVYAYEEIGASWVDVEPRVKTWDNIIDLIESGVMRQGFFANSLYLDLMTRPEAAIEKIYSDLRLPLAPEAKQRMLDFLAERHDGSHGNKSVYKKSASTDARTRHERALYKPYQDYFGVPDEI